MKLLSRTLFLQRLRCSLDRNGLGLRICPAHILLILMCLLMLLSTVGCGDDSPGNDGGTKGDSTMSQDSSADMQEDADQELGELGEEVEEEPDARYSLKMHAQPGATYTYRLVRSQVKSASGFDARQTQTYDMKFKVMSVNDDGSSVLGVTFNRVRVKIVAPVARPDSAGNPILDSTGSVKMFEETVEFDSDKAQDLPGSEEYRALINREMLVTIARDGSVQDVANTTPVLNALLKTLKVNPDTVDPRQLQFAQNRIDTEVLTAVTLIMRRNIPDSAMPVGGTWAKSDEQALAGGIPAKTTYTHTLGGLREVDGEQVVRVDVKLSTDTKIPKESMDNELISMKISSMDVSGEGESVFSVNSGFPLQKKTALKTHFAGSGTMKQGPDKGKSEKVNFRETVSTSVKLIASSAAPGPGQ